MHPVTPHCRCIRHRESPPLRADAAATAKPAAGSARSATLQPDAKELEAFFGSGSGSAGFAA